MGLHSARIGRRSDGTESRRQMTSSPSEGRRREADVARSFASRGWVISFGVAVGQRQRAIGRDLPIDLRHGLFHRLAVEFRLQRHPRLDRNSEFGQAYRDR